MSSDGIGQVGRVTLVLGGARSGKSARAQTIAEAASPTRLYLATAQAFDDEMRDRIARHRADRAEGWRTVECPLDLPEAIGREAAAGAVLLVDCLTLWASNLLLADEDADAATDRLLTTLAAAPCPVVIVSNEVGLGIVPDNALARRFRDIAGRMNQRVAAASDDVVLMMAGLELRLK
ncbi:bifunctional adenosylcobinamide kinase/adenosylcobinamide-phosphate guanylyltransferase [Sphingomonas sp. Leaf343]|uniref:bifunctional adenosylcobinamide kinase/adenosylcobinamide-phosphate guanylyltransferase n=1 Tax=Sphingomonas sp. Leaf343 TaxID=1736345 RepID=UPI0006FBFCE6|nr:bifunctional adenosylcobinamide kinase/adenosylcobinamide-phosphate guanylyltransferase [Sphingomonas sp. Leaf343]KQR87949.1 adenosylcobinamide kinase/adenosylcobinamide phosphate guanyltransferase [Sphingomonas sp. Leaf343]